MVRRILFFSAILFSMTIQAQLKGVEHFILIGVDGMGSNYLKEMEDIPNMKRMMKEGTYTMKARCIRPSSSAANWAAMTMGAGPELTGYTKWDSQVPEIPSRTKGEYDIFPTVFEVIKMQQPNAKIGAIYSWSGIGYLFPKEVMHKNLNTNSDSLTLVKAVDYIKTEKPNLLYLHFDNVDGAGHGIGWGTEEYKTAIETIDGQIGEIVNAVEAAGIADKTVFLVTADHGGVKKGHGGDDIKEMEIPWIISGKNIKADQRLDISVVTYDTAATIAEIFGVEQPQVWTGRPIRKAFKK